MNSPSALLAVLALAGVAPAKIPGHTLYADDGDRKEVEGGISFAFVGNLVGEARSQSIVASIATAANQEDGPKFVALLGNMTDAATTSGWADHDKRMKDLLDGTTLQELPSVRLPTLPVAGLHEGKGDPAYVGFGAAYPGVGQNIGFGRVATWYSFDLVSAGSTWRFIALDADQKRLASRWDEQLRWLDGVADGDYDGLILMMAQPVYDLCGAKPSADRDPGAAALLDRVMSQVDERKLKAVLSGGAPCTEVFQPDGPLTTLFVTAGGGGMAMADISREAKPASGKGEALSLETNYDVTLTEAVNRWNKAAELPQEVIDQAKGKGKFEGLPGKVLASAVPTYGWWMGRIEGSTLMLEYRMWAPTETYIPTWRGVVNSPGAWAINP